MSIKHKTTAFDIPQAQHVQIVLSPYFERAQVKVPSLPGFRLPFEHKVAGFVTTN